MQLLLRRLDALATEPQRNDGGFDPMLQQRHRGAMPEGMRRDSASLQRRARGAGRLNMSVDETLQCIRTEKAAAQAGKDGIIGLRGLFRQPVPDRRTLARIDDRYRH